MRRPDREDKKNLVRRKESCLSPRLIIPSLESLASIFRALHYENPQPQLLRNLKVAMAMGSDFSGQDLLTRIAQTPDRLRKIRLKGYLKLWRG